MNLLPPDYKKELPYEAWARYLTTIAIYGAVLALIGLMLLLPSFFFLQFQIGGLEDELSAIQALDDFKEMFAGKTRVDKLNKSLAAFVDFEAKSRKAHPVINNFIELADSRIDIQTASYKQNEQTGEVNIELTGKTPLRSSFLTFLEELKADPLVAEVDSPITNLLSETNVQFNVKIKIRQQP